MEHDDAVSTFSGVTGANAAKALHFLEACEFDMDAAISMYFETGGEAGPPGPGPAARSPSPPRRQPPRSASGGAIGGDEDPVDVEGGRDDDVIDLDGDAGPESGDPDLQAALAASLGASRPASEREHTWMRQESEERKFSMGARPRGGGGAGRSYGPAPIHAGPDDMPSIFGRSVFQDPAGTRPRHGANAPHLRGQSPRSQASGGAGASEALPDLPDDINAEEARMLEAAMLGVPYEGRIPDFTRQANAEPADPDVAEARDLRADQDAEYFASLAADREKERAATAARNAEQAAAAAAAAAEQAAKDAAEKAAAEKRALLARKRAAVPAEPAADDTDALTVAIRLPDGSRHSRRFKRSDPVSAMFDYVDVMGADAELDTEPGSYSLVTQFPRRVMNEDSTQSLQAAGLTGKQEALFMEPKR